MLHLFSKGTVYIIITQLLFGDINVADMKTLAVFEVYIKLDKMWLTSICLFLTFYHVFRHQHRYMFTFIPFDQVTVETPTSSHS